MRTYQRRGGRISRGQRRALLTFDHLITRPPEPADASGPPDWDSLFSRSAPLGLEIGFGMGQALHAWAAAEPDWNLIGIEIYQPGIGALLLGAEAAELDNLRVLEEEAYSALSHRFRVASLDEVRIYFPDPWPKKRHHKRRLVQPDFAHLLATRLKPGGTLYLASDWQPYAEWMLAVLDAENLLENVAGRGCFSTREERRPITKFEARGQALGHDVWDLAYRRVEAAG